MILVTGGAGFIGSNLVASLDDQGLPVAVCDHLGSGDKWKNLAARALEECVAPGELNEFLARRGHEVRYVFHMGAISSTTETDADLIVETNVRLPQALWRWCAERGFVVVAIEAIRFRASRDPTLFLVVRSAPAGAVAFPGLNSAAQIEPVVAR